jgi:hypothetical protein
MEEAMIHVQTVTGSLTVPDSTPLPFPVLMIPAALCHISSSAVPSIAARNVIYPWHRVHYLLLSLIVNEISQICT